jgi:hypothetical protein
MENGQEEASMARPNKRTRPPQPACALQPLEPRLLFTALPGVIVEGGVSLDEAVLWNLQTNKQVSFALFQPFGIGFTGGLNSALGDINGDGVPDVVFAPASHGKPLIRIYNALTGAFERNFFAYDQNFWGGVNLAVADINGDGKDDIITAPASNGLPLVYVFDGATGRVLRAFYAYETRFTGGLSVAAADVNADGTPDIITGAGYGGGPRVEVFSGLDYSVLDDFYAFNPAFRGGIVVTAGDMQGNGHADIAVGVAFGAQGNIRIFSGADLSLRREIVAGVTWGVSLALTDYDGDGLPDLITTGKYPQSTVTGRGIYKGTDFTFLSDWGNGNVTELYYPGFLISGWTAP